MKNMSLKINRMSIVMFASLAVNFFVIGFIASEQVTEFRKDKIRMTKLEFDHSISKLVDPFPRKAKREFYVTMRGKRDELIPIYKKITDKRAAIMVMIGEDQIDADKIRAAMNDYHEIYHDLVGPSQDVIISVLGSLSVEERQEILERYNNPPKRKWRRDDDRRRRSYSKDKDDHDGDKDDDGNDHDW